MTSTPTDCSNCGLICYLLFCVVFPLQDVSILNSENEVLGLGESNRSTVKNYMMRNFIICALRLLLLGARIRLRAGHQRNRESMQEMLLFSASSVSPLGPTSLLPSGYRWTLSPAVKLATYFRPLPELRIRFFILKWSEAVVAYQCICLKELITKTGKPVQDIHMSRTQVTTCSVGQENEDVNYSSNRTRPRGCWVQYSYM